MKRSGWGSSGALELGLRVAGFEYHAPEVVVGAGQGLNRFDPRWLWEPRPGATADRCGNTINADGYRGAPHPRTPPPGVLRIATIGDSSTFGLGVCTPQTYAMQLERHLPRSKVLNFGVIGFTALQGSRLLEGRVLAYQPRVLVAAFGAVNEAIPALDMDVETRLARAASVQPWAMRLRDLRIMQLAERWILPPLPLPGPEDVVPKGVDSAPNETVDSFARALRAIVETSRAHGAEAVLVVPPRRGDYEAKWATFPAYDAAVRGAAAATGAPLADVHDAFRSDPRGDDVLFVDAVHPSAAGHELYARVVADAVRKALLAVAGGTRRGAVASASSAGRIASASSATTAPSRSPWISYATTISWLPGGTRSAWKKPPAGTSAAGRPSSVASQPPR
ncbi:MAG TPA: SGNH/GDSL hydrolase family protein [Candidatus Eisenbacteria bacterium]|nr:SGNH/GDSL hydrolase family protein [Candidatus Eisenbacteria bacterium]